ncbi:MAG: hypothetical protein HC769_04500 [Cyanobacteria bacterium CRU_2_1]|nr:hypothetical protein [Cyanobacteria bacterium RU_5_0]NJR58174.1 hypothetical protein [Cyanobacteria bacterium CRU_2_1]
MKSGHGFVEEAHEFTRTVGHRQKSAPFTCFGDTKAFEVNTSSSEWQRWRSILQGCSSELEASGSEVGVPQSKHPSQRYKGRSTCYSETSSRYKAGLRFEQLR